MSLKQNFCSRHLLHSFPTLPAPCHARVKTFLWKIYCFSSGRKKCEASKVFSQTNVFFLVNSDERYIVEAFISNCKNNSIQIWLRHFSSRRAAEEEKLDSMFGGEKRAWRRAFLPHQSLVVMEWERFHFRNSDSIGKLESLWKFSNDCRAYERQY